jgi:hypothetical protein
MKDTAYSFAREVDQQIEALAPDDYHRKFGRSKQLQEELYPISRLALQLKQPGLEVEVEAFEDDGPVDGYIRISGFREREFDVEVTCVYDYNESLRRELLVSEGSAPVLVTFAEIRTQEKFLPLLPQSTMTNISVVFRKQ